MSDPTYLKGRRPLTVDDVLKLLPGVSRRKLLDLVKKIGCASKIGNKYFFEETDVQALLQETRLCRSKGVKASRRFTALTAEAEYEKALALVMQKKRKGSSSKSNPGSIEPKSSAKPASPPSLRLVASMSNKVAT